MFETRTRLNQIMNLDYQFSEIMNNLGYVGRIKSSQVDVDVDVLVFQKKKKILEVVMPIQDIQDIQDIIFTLKEMKPELFL
ncbi:MAG: hypothetical protein J7L15_02220 [Clostridiales bacterium]|nr:hypothetical protein [Clostridiales bacterium]